VEGRLPDLLGATTWLNSPPLSPQALRGKVVLVDFWTFARINCQRALPHVRAWAEKYKDEGLIVIGVHSPEFAFERDIANVKRANDFAIWRAFSNQYWPAHYFVDAPWRETASCIRAGSCSHSRLLPWISMKRKVTLAAARLASTASRSSGISRIARTVPASAGGSTRMSGPRGERVIERFRCSRG
jgi:thiol-disulfide isomerase/thioredoxin